MLLIRSAQGSTSPLGSCLTHSPSPRTDNPSCQSISPTAVRSSKQSHWTPFLAPSPLQDPVKSSHWGGGMPAQPCEPLGESPRGPPPTDRRRGRRAQSLFVGVGEVEMGQAAAHEGEARVSMCLFPGTFGLQQEWRERAEGEPGVSPQGPHAGQRTWPHTQGFWVRGEHRGPS